MPKKILRNTRQDSEESIWFDRHPVSETADVSDCHVFVFRNPTIESTSPASLCTARRWSESGHIGHIGSIKVSMGDTRCRDGASSVLIVSPVLTPSRLKNQKITAGLKKTSRPQKMASRAALWPHVLLMEASTALQKWSESIEPRFRRTRKFVLLGRT